MYKKQPKTIIRTVEGSCYISPVPQQGHRATKTSKLNACPIKKYLLFLADGSLGHF